MSPHELELTAMLADMILPATDSAPAPSSLGIEQFVDEWISAPYPDQRADRQVIRSGLVWLNDESNRRWGAPFVKADERNRSEILNNLVRNEHAEEGFQNNFFERFRFIVVGGYYTTPEGFRDIGYIGNIALPSYPAVTEQERGVIDAELRRLGIENQRSTNPVKAI
jgi:hypothetical protein